MHVRPLVPELKSIDSFSHIFPRNIGDVSLEYHLKVEYNISCENAFPARCGGDFCLPKKHNNGGGDGPNGDGGNGSGRNNNLRGNNEQDLFTKLRGVHSNQ